MELNRRIRDARIDSGLAQKELGIRCGVTRLTVTRWESGDRVPSFDTLQKIAKALSKPVTYFIGENEPLVVDAVKPSVDTITDIVKNKAYDFPGAEDELAAVRALAKTTGSYDKAFAIIEACKAAGLGIRPAEQKKKLDNPRDRIPRYHVSESEKGGKVPKWLNLAAGDGSDLELSEEFLYFDEIKTHPGLHAAVIRGESMCDTLVPGDVVVLEEMPGGVWELPPLDGDVKNSYRIAHAKVAHDDICVLSINDDTPTIKRVTYDVSRGMLDWQMLILAENPTVWPARAVTKRDHVKFYAKMIGLAEKLPGAR